MYYKTAPRDYQCRIWNESKDKLAYAFFLEMGLGKSRIALDTLAYLFSQGRISAAVITSTKGSYHNWIKEIEKHWPTDNLPYKVRLWETSGGIKKQRLDTVFMNLRTENMLFLIVNIEAFSYTKGKNYVQEFVSRHKCAMIVDESTTIKNNSLRTRNAIKVGRSCTYRRILTGSPVTRSPQDIFYQFRFLGNDLLPYRSYTEFTSTFCTLKNRMIRVGQNMRAIKEITGYKNIPLLKRQLAPHSAFLLKKDALDLPEKIYEKYEVELTKEQKELCSDIKKKALILLNEGDNYLNVPLVISKLIKMHQVICGHFIDSQGKIHRVKNNRIQALLNVLEELNEDKVIIWCRYLMDARLVQEELDKLKGAWVLYNGSVSNTQRKSNLERFKNDDSVRFFIASPQVAGYGLDLQHCDKVIYYSNDYDYGTRIQSEDRCHRLGQTNHVTYVDLVAPGTVDEKILSALQQKKRLGDLVMAGGATELFDFTKEK